MSMVSLLLHETEAEVECLYRCMSQKIFACINYRAREIFGEGKFWQAIQVKTIGKEKFGK